MISNFLYKNTSAYTIELFTFKPAILVNFKVYVR